MGKISVLSSLEKVVELEEELEEYLPDSFENFQGTRLRACEMMIQLVLEAVIDTSKRIVKDERLGLPDDEETVFDLLVDEGIISQDVSERMKDARKFRNVLVHRYGRIDERKSFDNIKDNREDFRLFVDEIRQNYSSGNR